MNTVNIQKSPYKTTLDCEVNMPREI